MTRIGKCNNCGETDVRLSVDGECDECEAELIENELSRPHKKQIGKMTRARMEQDE